MSRVLLAATALVLLGCGGVRLEAGPSRPEQTAHRVGGREVIAITRPLDGDVAVTAWLDAGALDGPNASIPLVAAEIVAPAETEAIVFPDGTAFRRLCSADGLDACVRELAEAIASHEVTEERLSVALTRVRERRERGLGDARREAEALATSAALGVELSPLGDADDDVTVAAVRAFLEAHYGDERSLWVAVGDVTASRWEAVLASQPSARANEARRGRNPRHGGGARTAERVGDEHWALARRGAEADVLALANAWSRRIGLARGLRVAAFPTRAGWVALASGEGPSTDVLLRVRDAAPWPVDDRAHDEDAFDIAMRLGARWIAREASTAPSVGMAVIGPDAEATAAGLATSDATAPWARAEMAPIDDADALAVAWALAGPAADGPESLGASVLAAEIFAHRCVVDGSVATTPDAIVVTRAASVPLALAEASFWTDCVALTTPTEIDVETARRALVARVDDGAERRTLAARAIAADAPGLVATRPSRDALSAVPAADVIARWTSWRDSGRWGMAGATGALSGMRERTDTPGGTEPRRASAAPAERARARATTEGGELLLVASLPRCGSSARAAVLLEAWRRELSEQGAIIAWSESGASTSFGWAAVTLRADEALLAGPEHYAPSRAAIEASRGEGGIRARRSRATLAGPTTLAVRMALGAPDESCAAEPIVRSVQIEPFPTGRR